MSKKYTLTSFVGVPGSVTIDSEKKTVYIVKEVPISYSRIGAMDLSEFSNREDVIPWESFQIDGFRVIVENIRVHDSSDMNCVRWFLEIDCVVDLTRATVSPNARLMFRNNPKVLLPTV